MKVWLSNFLMYIAFMLLTPLLPLYLSDTFGANKETIGLVLSGYAVAALLIRPFSGFFVDSFPRKTVLLICFALTTLFFGGYLVSGSILAFAIFRTLHGAPFGATGVSLSTVAIDVLPSSRRAEGIGYYGLSNNIATAIAPSIALFLYARYHDYNMLFVLSMVASLMGVLLDSTLRLRPRELDKEKEPISLDRFLLLKGGPLFVTMFTVAFAYSVVSTYVAIYGKEIMGITEGTGMFFALLSIGLIVSRLTGSQSLKRGLAVRNASGGLLVSIASFVLFAAVHEPWAYYLSPFILGLGNGHLWPAFQTMFINLAPNSKRGTANSTLLTSWDLGMGAGMLLGGSVAERFSYYSAFWVAVGVYALGIAFYFLYGRRHFLANRLR